MRRSRLLLSLSAVSLVAAALIPASAGSVGAHETPTARSDFSRSFKAVDTRVKSFDPVATEKERNRKIAALRFEPGLGSTTGVLTQRRAESLAKNGKVAPRPTGKASPQAIAPTNLRRRDFPVPGTISWGITWDTAPNRGCAVGLFRTSDNAFMGDVEGTGFHCGAAYLEDFFGVPLVAGTNYYAQVLIYDGSSWSASVTSASWPAIRTPGIPPYGALGNCVCGTSTGRQQQTNSLWDDPINAATGAFVESLQDAKMPAPGIAFDLTRQYSSADPTTGLLGKGWTFPYEASLKIETSKVTYRAEDGQQVEYLKSANGTFTTPAGVTSKLAAITGGYTLRTKTHHTLTFDTAGRLTSWKDGSNQGLTFGHTSGVLSSITDAAGRVVSVTVSGGRVAKVTLPDSRNVQYTYTGSLLTSVRDLRGGTTAYEYDAGSRLANVRDQKNRLITQNTYDSTTGWVIRQINARGKLSTYALNPATGDSTRKDPRGRTWTDVYRGNVLLQSIDPLGNATTYGYNTLLQRVEVVDGNGRSTKMTYDAAGNMLTRTSPAPLNYVESWKYDAAGNVIEHTDKRQKVTKYAYDTANRLTNVTDAALGETIYTYTAKGLVETEKTPRGKVTEYSYDTAGNRLTAKGPLLHTTSYTYDSVGRLRTETDPRGTATSTPGDFTTAYDYDAADNLASVTDARGNTTRYEYDSIGNLEREIDPYEKVILNTYSAARLILSRKETDLPAETYAYDDNGNLEVVTDPSGGVTRYGYDAADRRTSMVTPRGAATVADDYVWEYRYDAAGNQIEVEDPLGNVTKTKYDEVNRPVEVTDPLVHTTKTAYDQNDNVTRVTNHLNQFTQSGYDALNRLDTTTDARGKITDRGYDADSHLLEVKSPLGYRTTYTYDDDGRQVTMVDPRGNVTGRDPLQYTWRYGYDAVGNQTSVTDPLANVTETTFDAVNNRASVKDALDHTTAWGYDKKNRLTKVTAADTGETSYGYDDLDRLISRTDPRTKVTTYGYDAMGRLKETVDPLGRKVSHEYFEDGTLKKTVRARGNAAGADPVSWTVTADYDQRGLRTAIGSPDAQVAATFTYDVAGRYKTSVGGFGGTRTYTYDNADRLTGVARGSESFAYGYDADGRVTSRTYPDGNVITATYDEDGRQATSTRAGQAVTLAYDEADGLTRLTYPAGTGYSEGRNYDRAGRLIAVSSSKASVVLSRFDVIRDGVGNPTRVKSTRSAVVTDESYLYDQNDRLTKVCNTPVCDATATATIVYGYDKSGNRLTETRVGAPNPGVTTNVYDDADQLSTSTKGSATTSYTWDADGNLASAGSATYTFDAANRLRSRVSGATTYTASYDGDGHRAQIAATGQTAKNLAWDLNGELPMLAVQSIGSGRTAIRYTETGIPMEVIAGTQATPTDYAWLTHDHMGSVVDTITAAGVPETKSTYEPFGAATRTKLDPAALDTLLGYTGERLDPTLGLVHLRARDYDPSQGRFLATDPLTPAIGDFYVAGYIYALNQPAVYTDPSGLIVIGNGPGGGGGGGGPGRPPGGSGGTGPGGVGGGGAGGSVPGRGLPGRPPKSQEPKAPAGGGSSANPYGGTTGGTWNRPGGGLARANPNGCYEPSPKHGQSQRGRSSRAPTNPQETLDNSIPFSANSTRRVGIDPETGELVVFAYHRTGRAHGYVVKWSELTQAMQSALRKAGLVNDKGKIVKQ